MQAFKTRSYPDMFCVFLGLTLYQICVLTHQSHVTIRVIVDDRVLCQHPSELVHLS